MPDRDDLTQINGVGPSARDLLHELGINTFDDLAAIDDDMIATIMERTPVYPERIQRDDWVAQARALAEERRNR